MYRDRMTSSKVWIPDEGSRPFLGTMSPKPIVLNAEKERVTSLMEMSYRQTLFTANISFSIYS